jgi:uncharacterized delta-60 repeat protein
MFSLPISFFRVVNTDVFSIGTGFNNIVYWTELNPSDQKLYCVGTFTTYGGASSARIVRLNTNGSRDTSFAVGTGLSSDVLVVKVQPSDSKVLVGGFFTAYNGSTANRIVRINTDGTIDGSFNTGTGFDNAVYTIDVQTDGKIICAGQFLNYNGTAINRIIRLNTDGSIDGSFAVGTGFGGQVYMVKIQPDGKILVGGFFTSYNGVTKNGILRLNTNGSIDGTFGGTGSNLGVNNITLQPDNKIILTGSFTSYSGNARNRIVRVNSDGTIDGTFTIGTGLNSTGLFTALQADGKILVGGNFTSFNGVAARNYIVRLNTDGTHDATFNMGTGFGDIVQSITVKPDTKVYIGGRFTTYKGLVRNRLVRILSDGTLSS